MKQMFGGVMKNLKIFSRKKKNIKNREETIFKELGISNVDSFCL